MGGVQFDLSYDDSILSIFDSDSDGNLNEEIGRGSALTGDHTLTVNTSNSGLISAIAVGVTSMNPGAGSVINVTFQISVSAPPGNTPLTLSNLGAANPLGLPVSISGSNGSITVNVVPGNDPPVGQAP